MHQLLSADPGTQSFSLLTSTNLAIRCVFLINARRETERKALLCKNNCFANQKYQQYLPISPGSCGGLPIPEH